LEEMETTEMVMAVMTEMVAADDRGMHWRRQHALEVKASEAERWRQR
jgi:hypothetical protein